MGKIAGHPVIVRLKIEMTGRNAERAGHNDRQRFREYQLIRSEAKQ